MIKKHTKTDKSVGEMAMGFVFTSVFPFSYAYLPYFSPIYPSKKLIFSLDSDVSDQKDYFNVGTFLVFIFLFFAKKLRG